MSESAASGFTADGASTAAAPPVATRMSEQRGRDPGASPGRPWAADLSRWIVLAAGRYAGSEAIEITEGLPDVPVGPG